MKASGLGVEYKRGTNIVQRLWYTRKGKRFPASKIDRRFSYANIKAHLANNRPLHPQSKWMYADGSIVPIAAYKGIKLTQSQISDYVSGKTIRIDGCQGNHSTVYIKFDPARMVPTVFSSNPNAPHQSKTVQSQGTRITLSTPSFRENAQDYQGFSGGDGISGVIDTVVFHRKEFKIWLSRHPGLSIDEVLRRYRDE